MHVLPALVHTHTSFAILNFQSGNNSWARFVACRNAAKTSRINVNTHPRSPPHKVQASLCCTFRGNIHSPSSDLEPQRHNFHRNYYHHSTGLRFWCPTTIVRYHAKLLVVPGNLLLVYLHMDMDLRTEVHPYTPTHSPSSPGRLFRSPHLHLAESLCRICLLAAI